MIKINSNLYLENDKRPDHFTFMIIYVTEFLEGIARYFLKVHKRGSTWGEAIKIYSPQGFPQVLRTWGGEGGLAKHAKNCCNAKSDIRKTTKPQYFVILKIYSQTCLNDHLFKVTTCP